MKSEMLQMETRRGTRVVVSTRNASGQAWRSRLYVNDGQTPTLLTASHRSQRGARQWAARTLAEAE